MNIALCALGLVFCFVSGVLVGDAIPTGRWILSLTLYTIGLIIVQHAMGK